jgi:hypothetical protein
MPETSCYNLSISLGTFAYRLGKNQALNQHSSLINFAQHFPYNACEWEYHFN